MMTTTSSKELKIASVSDIHTGHPRTPTIHILNNLRTAFPANSETQSLDIIFIAGDFFDRLLRFPELAIPDIELWIHEFLFMAKKFNIIVRVLEGTPSHDWKQSTVFERINKNSKIGCNLKYIDKLWIEYIPELDINVLYIPDEWSDSTESTLSQVRELMTSKGLSSVDYAIMHGQFPHQLPQVAKAPKHNSDAYLQLVDKLIFIGHDHHFSVHERIISHGSFDRLSHGEEEPKGHVRATVRSRDDYELMFVENKNAKIYKTVDCKDWSVEEALIQLKKTVEVLPLESNVRVKCYKGSALAENIAVLERTWPNINWSKKVEDSDGDVIENSVDVLTEDDFIPIQITKDNIQDLVMSKLTLKTNDPLYLEIAQQFLREVR